MFSQDAQEFSFQGLTYNYLGFENCENFSYSTEL